MFTYLRSFLEVGGWKGGGFITVIMLFLMGLGLGKVVEPCTCIDIIYMYTNLEINK